MTGHQTNSHLATLFVVCRAATKVCARMVKATTALSMEMCMKGNLGRTAWPAVACTALHQRAGETAVLRWQRCGRAVAR